MRFHLHKLMVRRPKAVSKAHGEQPLVFGWEVVGPFGASSQHGVCEDEKFSRACHEGELVRFAGGFEATVQVDQGFVPFEGRWLGSGVEAFSQAGAASFDMPASFSVATVVIEGREPGEGCGLFAR